MSIPEITVGELAGLLAAGGVSLFDVRNPDEFTSGHVPAAVLVPLHEVPDRVGEFPTSGVVHVICRSGGRSGQAVEFLRSRGVNAVNIAGGTLAWVDAGYEVATGDAS
ncbi:MAG: hypothetical protein RL219_1211 [Actinomycetota bacterium]|jgi:rhodanese-related sulfurtransferase